MIILAVSSYVWLAVTVLWGGLIYPEYSHISQFMSELGATGATHGNLTNYLGFLGAELLLLGALGLALKRLPRAPVDRVGFGFLVAYPVLISVAAIFPCDFECQPADPTLKHLVHMTSGLSAYLCAMIGLVMLSYQQGQGIPSRRLKAASLFFFPLIILLLFNITPDNHLVGAVQRTTETLIYIWLISWLLVMSK